MTRDRENDRCPRDRSPDQGPGLAGVINTIAGRPTGEDSQNSQKRTYREAYLDCFEPNLRLDQVLSYGPDDPVPSASGNHKALVIEVVTNNYLVKKVYIDACSSVDVMYYRTFQKMGLKDEQLTPIRTPLVG